MAMSAEEVRQLNEYAERERQRAREAGEPTWMSPLERDEWKERTGRTGR